MGLHLYCVTPAAFVPADVRGLDDAPVHAVQAAELAVWVSAAATPSRPSIDAARRHHEVVEAAMRMVTPIPLRFGQWLATEADVRERAAGRADQWNTQLAALAGTAEFGVRVLDPRLPEAERDVHPQRKGSGREYLQAIAGRGTERERRTTEGRRIAEQLEDAIGPSIVRSRVDPLETAHGLVSIAFLVPHPAEADYRDAITRAIVPYDGLRFLMSGPWPPYSFTT